MFQFSGFAHLSVYYVFNIVGCPIRISADQSVCACPRSFSQLITSFFASESLGIPHTPLFCLLYLYRQGMPCLYAHCDESQHVFFLLFVCIFYLNMSMNGFPFGIVENIGVEPMTSCVQGRRSSQLS